VLFRSQEWKTLLRSCEVAQSKIGSAAVEEFRDRYLRAQEGDGFGEDLQAIVRKASRQAAEDAADKATSKSAASQMTLPSRGAAVRGAAQRQEDIGAAEEDMTSTLEKARQHLASKDNLLTSLLDVYEGSSSAAGEVRESPRGNGIRDKFADVTWFLAFQVSQPEHHASVAARAFKEMRERGWNPGKVWTAEQPSLWESLRGILGEDWARALFLELGCDPEQPIDPEQGKQQGEVRPFGQPWQRAGASRDANEWDDLDVSASGPDPIFD